MESKSAIFPVISLLELALVEEEPDFVGFVLFNL
jgi:hypothetical protein